MLDYSKLLSTRILNMKPSGIRRFFDIASEMDDVISLGVGEPDFQTPLEIRKAGIQSLEEGKTWYTANTGLAELRTEIAKYLKKTIDVSYDSVNEVLVTVGGSEAIDICIRACINPGDEVLIPEPCFVAYAPMADLTGAVSVPIVTRVEDEFRLTAKALKEKITDKTKLLILPFPNNPTGAIMTRKDLEEIAEVLRGTNILVLTDEIYAELTYSGEKHVSIAQIDGMKERSIIVSGFSKAFAMTGWRLGYLAAPRPIMEEMAKIHQYAIMSAPTTAQYAAIKALRDCEADIQHMRNEYDARRKMIVSELNRIGLTCFEPKGAFYVFPSIKVSGMSSEDFCEALLQKEHVAVIPGTAFGDCGEGFVRISYSYSVEHIKEALIRIERFLKSLGK